MRAIYFQFHFSSDAGVVVNSVDLVVGIHISVSRFRRCLAVLVSIVVPSENHLQRFTVPYGITFH